MLTLRCRHWPSSQLSPSSTLAIVAVVAAAAAATASAVTIAVAGCRPPCLRRHQPSLPLPPLPLFTLAVRHCCHPPPLPLPSPVNIGHHHDRPRHCCQPSLRPSLSLTPAIVAAVSVVNINSSRPSPLSTSTIVGAISVVDISHHHGRLRCRRQLSYYWPSPSSMSAIVMAVSVVSVGHRCGYCRRQR